jgi:acetyl-CoA carboxylase biotin carboxylase subunit
MIAKLIVHRQTRQEAIATMSRALSEFQIEGVKTTIPLIQEIIAHPNFHNGNFDTGFIEEYFMS